MSGLLPDPDSPSNNLEATQLFGIPESQRGLAAHFYAMIRSCEGCEAIYRDLACRAAEAEVRYGWNLSLGSCSIRQDGGMEIHRMVLVDRSGRAELTTTSQIGASHSIVVPTTTEEELRCPTDDPTAPTKLPSC